MLAQLGNTSTWLRTHWPLRWPHPGAPYELWDCSVLLLVLGLFGYVLTDPPATTTEALAAPLRVINETQLGLAVTVAALVGMLCAYRTRWLRVGYIATISTSGALSLNFLVGYLTNATSLRAVISVVLYGWIARRLMFEAPRRPLPPAPCDDETGRL